MTTAMLGEVAFWDAEIEKAKADPHPTPALRDVYTWGVSTHVRGDGSAGQTTRWSFDEYRDRMRHPEDNVPARWTYRRGLLTVTGTDHELVEMIHTSLLEVLEHDEAFRALEEVGSH